MMVFPRRFRTPTCLPNGKQLRSLENLKILNLPLSKGANITLEFNAGSTLKKPKFVRDKVDQAKQTFHWVLMIPLFKRLTPVSFPVLTIKLSGDVPESILVNIANTLKDQIEENVSEILEVNILGIGPNRLNW